MSHKDFIQGWDGEDAQLKITSWQV